MGFHKKNENESVDVRVGEKIVTSPKTTNGGALKRAAGMEATRMLLMEKYEQMMIISDSEIIELEEGDVFDDIPTRTLGSQDKRIIDEIKILRKVFKKVSYDLESFLWVLISDFKLPKGFNKKQSELLIELPLYYPHIPPENFYMDRTIKTSEGKGIQHYYPDSPYTKYYDKGWAWCCIHLTSWRVNGNVRKSDNLLTSAEVIYLTLQELTN